MTTKQQRRAHSLISIQPLYHEPTVFEYARGREVLARFQSMPNSA